MIKSLSLGRYTLTEAVEIFLAHHPKFDREALVGDLRWLVNQKKIFAYHPGHAKSPNSISTDGSGEFYWEDLNAIWLPHFENQKWCFAKPIAKLKPEWAYWRLMKHVELDAAIYLSLNVNPYWKVFMEHLDEDTLVQYQARLTQVISWMDGAEWVVGSVKSKSFIEYTKISLKPLVQWFCDEMSNLNRPLEFDGLASLSGTVARTGGLAKPLEDSAVIDSGELKKPLPRTLRPQEWHPLAEQYATKLLTANDALSLTMVADRIRDQFIKEGINFVKGKGEVTTIKTHLSKSWGFNRQRTIIKNNKK